MGALLESKRALGTRGLEVSLTNVENERFDGEPSDSLARLAFAACGAGDTPTDDQITENRVEVVKKIRFENLFFCDFLMIFFIIWICELEKVFFHLCFL